MLLLVIFMAKVLLAPNFALHNQSVADPPRWRALERLQLLFSDKPRLPQKLGIDRNDDRTERHQHGTKRW